MSAAVPISPMPAATVAYVRAGLILVPFKLGTKGPKGADSKGWNLLENCIRTVERAAHHHGNIGLAHAYSRTVAIDIDDMPRAVSWFWGVGIDLEALWNGPDAVRWTSERKDRGKLLYRLPAGVDPLPTRSFKGDGVELRCATAKGLTVQDVLPPSMHPLTGRPYRWLGPATFQSIPQIPAHLLAFWQTLVAPRAPGADGRVAPMGVGREDIETLLACLHADPKDEYEPWLDVGFGLNHETRGSEVGLDLWDQWSKRGSNYKGREELESKWRGFDPYHPNPKTIHTIEKMAGVTLSMAAEYEVLPPLPDAPTPLPPTGAKGPRFHIETPTEFAAVEYEDDFIDGVLPDAPYGVIMGQSGSGKTFAAMDLAFSMARGVLWRGRDTKPARVLYIAAEGAVGVRKRLKAYAQHHGMALGDINVEFLAAAPDLTQPNDVRALIESIKGRNSTGNQLPVASSEATAAFTHIVIDTWSQVTPGADENSSHDMGAALKHVQTIHQVTGARILFIAHMGKDMTKGMRGWSGFKAAMDYEIEVSREGGQRKLTVSKSRDGEDGISFPFHLQPVTLGLTKRGKPVVSCVVVHDMAAPKRRPVTPVQIAVLATIELHFEASNGAWMSFENVLQTYKKRRGSEKGCLQPKKDNHRSAVQRALLQLVKKGWLEERDGNYRPFAIAEDL